LSKSQTLNHDWPELGLKRAKLGPNGEETWFSRAVSGITYCLYIITNN